jgi:hypothetical protein
MAVAAIGAAAFRLGEPIASGDPRLVDEVVRVISRPARHCRINGAGNCQIRDRNPTHPCGLGECLSNLVPHHLRLSFVPD